MEVLYPGYFWIENEYVCAYLCHMDLGSQVRLLTEHAFSVLP